MDQVSLGVEVLTTAWPTVMLVVLLLVLSGTFWQGPSPAMVQAAQALQLGGV